MNVIYISYVLGKTKPVRFLEAIDILSNFLMSQFHDLYVRYGLNVDNNHLQQVIGSADYVIIIPTRKYKKIVSNLLTGFDKLSKDMLSKYERTKLELSYIRGKKIIPVMIPNISYRGDESSNSSDIPGQLSFDRYFSYPDQAENLVRYLRDQISISNNNSRTLRASGFLDQRFQDSSKKLTPSRNLIPLRNLISTSLLGNRNLAELHGKEEETEVEGLKCVVCLDMKKNIAFIPCGHICCINCVRKMSSSPICPLCRQRIEEGFRVYI